MTLINATRVKLIFITIVTLIIGILYVKPVDSLKCYTGFKFVRGQTFGDDESKPCEDDSDYCYNMTAKGGILVDLNKAGCSTYRCLLARDKCIGTDVQGIPVNFCCCSTDFCNGQKQ